MIKSQLVELVEQLQLFYTTSFALLNVLWQPSVPLIAQDIADSDVITPFGKVESYDKNGILVVRGFFTNRAKVESLMNKEFGGLNQTIGLGRRDLNGTTNVNLSQSGPSGNNSNPSYYDLSIDSVFRATCGSGEYNFFHMRNTASLVISTVHDALNRHNLNNKSPEFEFLRHLRNAVSHGNCFTFHTKEPTHTAAFKNLVIDQTCQGFTPVLFGFIMPGDVMDLLDHIKNNV